MTLFFSTLFKYINLAMRKFQILEFKELRSKLTSSPLANLMLLAAGGSFRVPMKNEKLKMRNEKCLETDPQPGPPGRSNCHCLHPHVTLTVPVNLSNHEALRPATHSQTIQSASARVNQRVA